MDFLLYFQMLLSQCYEVALDIPYGLLRVFSTFLTNKHQQGGFLFRMQHGPSIRYTLLKAFFIVSLYLGGLLRPTSRRLVFFATIFFTMCSS